MRLREHPIVVSKGDQFQIDPRQLKIDSAYNVRNMDTPEMREKNAELKASIRENGVKVPVEIRFDGTDAWMVAGHRRLAMVLELIAEGEDIKAIPAIQEAQGTNDAERTLNLVVSNSGEPLKPIEIAEVVRRLLAFKWDKGQIAKRLGWKSTNSVQQHLDLLAMPEDLRQKIKSAGIEATTARKAVAELGVDGTRKLIEDNEKQGKKTRPRDVRAAAPPKKLTPAKPPVSDPPKPEAAAAKPAPSPVASAFAGNGTHEYSPEAEAPAATEPLPADAGVPPAASDAEPQAGVDSPNVPPSAPAAAASEAPKLTHLTKETFFEAAAPVADAMMEQVEFSEFQPGDQIGFQISFELATAFVAAVNQARGTS